MDSFSMYLLLLLFFCHWLADYTHLSTGWMLNAKRFGKPLLPIFYHAGMHAFVMALALYPFMVLDMIKPELWVVAWILQLGTHFLIDVWKGRMNGWIPSLQNPANKSHWYIFGFDQFLHAVVIISMVKTILE